MYQVKYTPTKVNTNQRINFSKYKIIIRGKRYLKK